MTAIEIYVLLCRLYPEWSNYYIASIIAPGCRSTEDLNATPTFLVGLFMVVTGVSLRLWCYQLMGSNFTFQLSIRKEHSLCKRGPYSVVRHPSYSGASLWFVGQGLCLLGGGTWWDACGIRGTIVGRAIALTYIGWTLVVGTSMFMRSRIEDKVLREVFGSQWDQWARETPYAIIPFIF